MERFRSIRLLSWEAWVLSGFLCWLLCLSHSAALAGDPAPSEYQVKATLLYNIVKYVDWPTNSFETKSAPLVIGMFGGEPLGDEFAKLTDGKTIRNRPVHLRHLEKESEIPGCHILFIGAAEKNRLEDILGRIRNVPILTVGETDDFLAQGGVICFAVKEKKVRFQVNLEEARLRQLHISSRALNLADTVIGKKERSAK